MSSSVLLSSPAISVRFRSRGIRGSCQVLTPVILNDIPSALLIPLFDSKKSRPKTISLYSEIVAKLATLCRTRLMTREGGEALSWDAKRGEPKNDANAIHDYTQNRL